MTVDNTIPWQMTTLYHERLQPTLYLDKGKLYPLTDDKLILWQITTLYNNRQQPTIYTERWQLFTLTDDSQPYTVTTDNHKSLTYDNLIYLRDESSIPWQKTTKYICWQKTSLLLDTWQPCTLTDGNSIPWQITSLYAEKWHRNLYPIDENHLPWYMTTNPIPWLVTMNPISRQMAILYTDRWQLTLYLDRWQWKLYYDRWNTYTLIDDN